jgi:3D (Asp-Asp-Asp) domain-containing protein
MLTTTLLAAAVLAASALGAPAQAPEDGGEHVAADTTEVTLEVTVVGYATGGDGGAVGSITASGTQVHWGTVAADWREFPPGTRLRIEGFEDVEFVVEDTGSGVRGKLIDIWFPDLATAQAFGTQRRLVTVLP